jgi:hypothetical protein
MLLVADELFLGANTAINPKKLGKGLGVNASNLDTSQGDFRGRRAASTVHTLTGYGGVQQHSIYRHGRGTVSDTQYWFAYASDVDFARSLLASDPLERTYGTGGVFTEPVYTDSTFITTAPYGQDGYALGIPKPGDGMTATLNTAGSGTNETRTYVMTFLRYNDDESWAARFEREADNKKQFVRCYEFEHRTDSLTIEVWGKNGEEGVELWTSREINPLSVKIIAQS